MTLRDVLESVLGASTGTPPELQWPCPFCLSRVGSESAKPKLRVNVDKGVATCFRCGYARRGAARIAADVAGRPVAGLSDVPALPAEARSMPLYAALAMRSVSDRASPLRAVPLPSESVPLFGPRVPRWCNRALRYLHSRGATPARIERFRLHYCQTGRYAQRIIFPVLQGGKVVYFTDRYAGEHPLKSLNPKNVPGFHTRQTVLLNYDNCVGAPRVCIVEGPFDALSADPAVSALGKGISPAQLDLLRGLASRGTREFVLLYDADARQDAVALYRRLVGVLPCVRVATLVQGDPNSERERIHAVINAAGAPAAMDAVVGL